MSSMRFNGTRDEFVTKISEDPRIDPRIKTVFGAIDRQADGTVNVDGREELLKKVQMPESEAQRDLVQAFLDSVNTEKVASSEGLTIKDLYFKSDPDGNLVKICFIRPNSDDALPCVYYIHGGGMSSMSC